MKLRYRTFIGLTMSLFFYTCAAAEQSKLYLQCKADAKYGDWDRLIEIDKAAHTIRVVLPSIEPLPLDKDDTDFYAGSIVTNGRVVYKLSVNRYTLRYSVFTSLSSPWQIEGKCDEVSKKI